MATTEVPPGGSRGEGGQSGADPGSPPPPEASEPHASEAPPADVEAPQPQGEEASAGEQATEPPDATARPSDEPVTPVTEAALPADEAPPSSQAPVLPGERPLPEASAPAVAQPPAEPASPIEEPTEPPPPEVPDAALPEEQPPAEPASPPQAQTRSAEPILFDDRPLPLRDRLLPRSVLGLSALVLAFAVGAAFSGAILYSYYEFKKDRTEKQVASFIQGFDKRFKDALATIDAESTNARAEIQKELEPLRKTRAEGQTLEALVKKLEPSLFFVSTLDEDGRPSVGSAFAVASDDRQTLLLASYTTVKAATRQPGPPVRVRRGNQEIRSTLWTWDEDKDLALIVLSSGNVPTLAFASEQLRPGERILAVSALGGAGGSITQGFVADVSSSGVQHDAAVGQAFQGGPLVNSEGGVVGVASRSYAPLGFSSDQVSFAPFVRAACERILRCGSGTPGAGDRGAPGRG